MGLRDTQQRESTCATHSHQNSIRPKNYCCVPEHRWCTHRDANQQGGLPSRCTPPDHTCVSTTTGDIRLSPYVLVQSKPKLDSNASGQATPGIRGVFGHQFFRVGQTAIHLSHPSRANSDPINSAASKSAHDDSPCLQSWGAVSRRCSTSCEPQQHSRVPHPRTSIPACASIKIPEYKAMTIYEVYFVSNIHFLVIDHLGCVMWAYSVRFDLASAQSVRCWSAHPCGSESSHTAVEKKHHSNRYRRLPSQPSGVQRASIVSTRRSSEVAISC